MRRISLHALVPLVIVAAWGVAISGVRISNFTDLGLVSALPASALVLLALLMVSFAVAVTRRPPETIVMLSHVVVLVVILYGVTAFVEPLPNYSTLYRMAGIVRYITHYHSVNPSIDAYFNWPGFFALGSLLTEAAGFKNVISYATYGSLAFNLLYLPPMLVIFSWATDDRRVSWLGVWVFYICNWVGQDYIIPQSVAYLLFLSLIAALLTWFTPRSANRGPAPSLRAVPRWFSGRQLRTVTGASPTAGAAQRLGVMLTVLVLYAATVSGHQLTPVPALVVVAALVVLAGLETRLMPVVMAVVLAAWISFMTTKYLAGNIGQLFNSLGALGSSVNQTTGRVVGSPEHEFVVDVRIFASLLIWALAGAGLLRRLRWRRIDPAIVILAGAPFLLPVLQPYGGEIFLRVFFFALPGVAFLIALLAFPDARAGHRWLTPAAIALVGCVLLGCYQFTRYGNERMNVFTRQDLAGVQALYRIAPVGSKVIAGTDNLPWRYQDYASYDYSFVDQLPAWETAANPDPGKLFAEIRTALAPNGGYVIFTRSTQTEAELAEGRPRALPQLISFLQAQPTVREVFHAGQNQIFFVRGP